MPVQFTPVGQSPTNPAGTGVGVQGGAECRGTNTEKNKGPEHDTHVHGGGGGGVGGVGYAD